MPISQSDQLFQLVKSLTKSEKRSFTLYASRIQDADSLKYMQLFDIIDKEKNCTDALIQAKMKRMDKTQYSNLKRHLYKQILSSLRMIHIAKKSDIEIREFLDFADVLYSKGLYLQALKILEKAKILAHRANNQFLSLAIIETEKTIESRHITRSGTGLVPKLISQSEEKLAVIDKAIRLSNARILLHGHYIQYGHVKNQEEAADIRQQYQWIGEMEDAPGLSYHERIFLLQAQVWYFYILLDFKPCLTAAEQWVDLFRGTPAFIQEDPDMMMRGYHYVLTCAYNLGQISLFQRYLSELEAFRDENYSRFSENTKIVSFLYVHYGRLNRHFLLNTYTEGLKGIPATLRRLQKYKDKLDVHRVMVFYFKIAWMYLMSGDPGSAIRYLNLILQMKMGTLREDIQGYSQLMFIMAHFDAGNEEILDYLIQGARQFFERAGSQNRLQEVTIRFFQQWNKLGLRERKQAIHAFYDELTALEKDAFELRSLLYLDIRSWLERKR